MRHPILLGGVWWGGGGGGWGCCCWTSPCEGWGCRGPGYIEVGSWRVFYSSPVLMAAAVASRRGCRLLMLVNCVQTQRHGFGRITGSSLPRGLPTCCATTASGSTPTPTLTHSLPVLGLIAASFGRMERGGTAACATPAPTGWCRCQMGASPPMASCSAPIVSLPRASALIACSWYGRRPRVL